MYFQFLLNAMTVDICFSFSYLRQVESFLLPDTKVCMQHTYW